MERIKISCGSEAEECDLNVTHLAVWGTDSICSGPRSCPRCRSSPPGWSGRAAACCYTRKQKHTSLLSRLPSCLDAPAWTYSLLGRGLLEAAALGYVPGGGEPRAALVRDLDVRLVEGMNDHRGVRRVVNAHVKLH